ncbi:MAG: hypothetical protein H6710_09375 [Myxococcales bacterium]|nr:hypothetical protein [Myxococcales bacterium]
MADLIGSSLALDDLSPLLRAHLIVRAARPLGGNNVAADDLERARRVFLGRGFEAAYLRRRLECLGCHHGGGDTRSTATTRRSIEPGLYYLALRRWSLGQPGRPTSARPSPPSATTASPTAPGALGASDACRASSSARAPTLGDAGHLGGPLPPGASARDLGRPSPAASRASAAAASTSASTTSGPRGRSRPW